jgi:DNA-binding transcriptional LysR family regulator
MLYLGREAGQIDRALAEYGMKRAVVLSLQPWISAAFAVANSDWIATVPHGLARYLAGPLKLAIVNFPFPVPPISIGAFWHNKNTMQPSSMWIRDGLVNTVREMGLGRQKIRVARK